MEATLALGLFLFLLAVKAAWALARAAWAVLKFVLSCLPDDDEDPHLSKPLHLRWGTGDIGYRPSSDYLLD